MDLKQLETFVHVAELGSFTRAATVLRIAQPALSRQVRALEVELRQPLFDRNGRGVTLTDAGRRLLAHGRGILQQVARAKQDLEDQRGEAAGRLAVGLPPSLSRRLTLPLVEAFRSRFPKASLSVVEGLSRDMLEWLALGRIDCAIVYPAQAAPQVDLLPIGEEALMLVSALAASRPPARPLTLAELAEHELVMPSRPHAIRMLVETALAAAGLKPRIALEIESVPAILDLVARHPLHAVLGASAVADRRDELLARPLQQPGGAPLTARLWLATSSQRPRGPLLDQGSAMLVAMLREQVLAPAQP